MDVVWFLLLIVFYNGCSSYAIDKNVSTRPDVVNIGSIFAFNSDIGKVAKVAIQAAVEDVNSNPDILGGTKLKLTMLDNNYSIFLGIVEACRFMERDIVAIIGPQSSVTARVLSHIANELQVPLLSFSATDPTLSSLQYPFFVRTTQNDLFQMAAIAEMVDYYAWREVIAIYIDDDSGRNGIAVLGDKLAERHCKISYKTPLNPEVSRDDITKALLKVASTDCRILVIHAYASSGLMIFEVAQHLGMMASGYVWIASSWLSTVSDTNFPLPPKTLDSIEGVVTLRIHTPDSELKRNFISRWSNLTNGKIGLNIYGSYAYDTVCLLAHAMDAFFKQGGNITFSNDSMLSKVNVGSLNLDAMSIFNGGNLLLHSILQVRMSGATGPIEFTSDGTRIRPAFEVLNVNGTGFTRVGYWSNYSGLSVMPPELLYTKPPNRSSSNQQLYDVIWPGQTTKKPRGWVFPKNGRPLIIGVPNRVSYQEVVSLVNGTDTFVGYCIDVFTAALKLLPYSVPYKLVPFGDGRKNPDFTKLVSLIPSGVYDAAIGDITIITSRTRMVDFTHPFIESGLVVVAPVRRLNSNSLAILKPFTPMLWCVTALFSLSLGPVIWLMEHRMNDEFRGPPRKQVVTVLWFSISTLFGTQRENTVSGLGRVVLFIWLFVVHIITSSYTASLTSILTVQQLSSSIEGIESLISSTDPIGYQLGSYARNYLIEELNIDKSRLVPLNSPEDCEKALIDGPNKGGVAALIDERAFMELFLSTRCKFSIVGQAFTKNGWGFAFPRDSPLSIDMSTAILELSESGELEKIRNRWLVGIACSSQGKTMGGDRLQLESFWGLFVVCGLACFLALFIYVMIIIRQFYRYYPQESGSSVLSSPSTRLQTFLSFVSDKEEEVKIRPRRRQLEGVSNRNYEEESMNNSRRSKIEISKTEIIEC